MATRDVNGRRPTKSRTFRWRGAKSSVRTIGVVVSSGAIGVAVVVASGTQMAGSANAGTFPTATASATATVSGVADDSTATGYLQKLVSVDQQMESAVSALANGVQNGDWDAAGTACQQLSGSGDAFRAMLPSPDSRVSPRVEQAADDVSAASGVCRTFGAGTTTQADWDQCAASIKAARSDLTGAAQILRHPR